MTPPKHESRDSVNEINSWMTAVFVARADQPSILAAHLPLLIQTASLAYPSKPPIRLVSLPSKANERLSTSLDLPRVGVIGLLEGAPGTDDLVEFVRRNVSAVEMPWLQGAMVGSYLPVSIKVVETSAPVAPRRKGLRGQDTDKPD